MAIRDSSGIMRPGMFDKIPVPSDPSTTLSVTSGRGNYANVTKDQSKQPQAKLYSANPCEVEYAANPPTSVLMAVPSKGRRK